MLQSPHPTITENKSATNRHSQKSWLLVLCITLLCSSCLYSRLLSFKEQLASFDDCVAIANGGHTLEFLKPVVRAGDLTDLTGFPPSRIDWTPDGQQIHTYRYRSLSPVGSTGTAQTLSFALRFSTNGLAAFDYPTSVAEVLGTNFIAAASKAIGNSRLLQRESRLDWAGTNRNSTLIPTRDAIAKILGPPQTITNTAVGATALYRYQLENTNGTMLADAPLSADLRFDPATSLLTYGMIHVGRLKLVVDFPAANQ